MFEAITCKFCNLCAPVNCVVVVTTLPLTVPKFNIVATCVFVAWSNLDVLSNIACCLGNKLCIDIAILLMFVGYCVIVVTALPITPYVDIKDVRNLVIVPITAPPKAPIIAILIKPKSSTKDNIVVPNSTIALNVPL